MTDQEFEKQQDLGAQLQRYRRQTGKTQKELAYTLNTSPSTIYKIEAGERRITPQIFQRWLQALELNDPEQAALQHLFDELEQLRTKQKIVKKKPASHKKQPADLIEPVIAEESVETTPAAASTGAETTAHDVLTEDSISHSKNFTAKPGYLLLASSTIKSSSAIGLGILLLVGSMLALIQSNVSLSRVPPQIRSLLPIERCTNQPTDHPALWMRGASADSHCTFTDQNIELYAGMFTALDSQEPRKWTAPMVLYPIKGDVIARVQMIYDGGPKNCCRNAGIGVRLVGDEQTWVSMIKESRDYHLVSSGMIYGKTTRAPIANDDLPVIRQPLTYLEMARQGSTITFRYSLDGQTWHQYASFYHEAFHTDLEFFLTVYADHGAPPVGVTFTKLSFQPLPPAPVN